MSPTKCGTSGMIANTPACLAWMAGLVFMICSQSAVARTTTERDLRAMDDAMLHVDALAKIIEHAMDKPVLLFADLDLYILDHGVEIRTAFALLDTIESQLTDEDLQTWRTTLSAAPQLKRFNDALYEFSIHYVDQPEIIEKLDTIIASIGMPPEP